MGSTKSSLKAAGRDAIDLVAIVPETGVKVLEGGADVACKTMKSIAKMAKSTVRGAKEVVKAPFKG